MHEATRPTPKVELEPEPAPASMRAPEPPAPTSEDRLRAMFDANFDFVWRSLRRLGVPSATVDDAAQEVFLVASRKLASIELGRERSFLFATALRVASTARRAQSRRGEHDEQAVAGLVDHAANPEEQADRQRARAVLDRILAEMEDDLRAVFVLYELEELTMAEIATTLELAPGTVASRLRRAREQFQETARRLRGHQ
ncbi:MAG TPA: sigma-70 family RNA polymerase sigma factor [Kofleriaceae bacterium]|nr:sigma-70 family RNA polymerase sigma factor [Kofleriaceae bacterium]